MRKSWTHPAVVVVPAVALSFLAGLALGAAERPQGPPVVVRVSRTCAPAPAPAPVTLAPPTSPAPAAALVLSTTTPPLDPDLEAELASLGEVQPYSVKQSVDSLYCVGLDRAARTLLDVALSRWPEDDDLLDVLQQHDTPAFIAACERAYALTPDETHRDRLLEVWCEAELHDREAALARAGLATQESWALARLLHVAPAEVLGYFDRFAGTLGGRADSVGWAARACDELDLNDRAAGLRRRANAIDPESGWAYDCERFSSTEEIVAYYRGQALADPPVPGALERLGELAPEEGLVLTRARGLREPQEGYWVILELRLLQVLERDDELRARAKELEQRATGAIQLMVGQDLMHHGDEARARVGAALVASAYSRGAARTAELVPVARLDPALALSVVRAELPREVFDAITCHLRERPERAAQVAAELVRVVEPSAELIREISYGSPLEAELLLRRALTTRADDTELLATLEGLRAAGR